MADAGENLAPAARHQAVGDLVALIGALQAQDGLTIGTERAQHAAALLARLAAAGITLDTPEAATAWLGPVLCVTAHDRRTLAARLERMAAAPEQPRVVAPLAGEQLAIAARRAAVQPWLLWAGLGGFVAAVLLGIAVSDMQGGGVTGLVVPASRRIPLALDFLADWLPYILPVLSGLALALVRRAVLAGRRVALPPPLIAPSGEGLRWFDEAALQGPLRMMGRQRRAAGRRLDLPETLRVTLARAGWPSVVRGGRPRTPDHVVLVQLRTADDPQRLAADALMRRLAASDLRATAFAFIGDPGMLTPLAGGPPETLVRIAGLHRGARLIVLSDGAVFHDSFSDAPRLPDAFDAFPVRVLLTPVPRPHWSWRETALEQADWQLAEHSTEGVSELARWLSGPREERARTRPEAGSRPDFAALLAQDARLFGATPPPSAVRAKLRQKLLDYLDPDPRLPPHGYDLLRALAVGVVLAPGTVARIGAHLAALDGPRPTEAALRRLLRLPWFGAGGLPPWLREDFLRDLPAGQRATARRAWMLYLADQPVGAGRLSAADEARLEQEAARRLSHPLTRADALMLGVLAPAPAPAASLAWRDTLLAASMPVAAAVAIWAVARLGPLLEYLAEALFSPLAGAIAGGAIWPPLVAIWFSAALFAPTKLRPRAVRLILALGALYFAAAPFLSGAWRMGGAMQGHDLAYAMALVATLGLIGLRVALPATPVPCVPRAAFVPGHPWLNAAAVLGVVLLAAAIMLLTDQAGFGTAPGDVIAAEFTYALALLVTGGAIAARLALAGFCARDQAWRGALGFVAGQAIGAGVLGVLAGLAIRAGLIGAELDWINLGAVLFLLRLVTGLAAGLGVFGMARATLMPRAIWPLAVALAAGLVGWGGGRPVVLLLMPLAVLAAVPIAARRPAVQPRWRDVAMLGGAGALGPALMMLVFSDSAAVLALIGAVGATPLLAWPLLRAMRPDLAVPSDGLWWRCLALLPCWIGLHALGDGFGPLPLLAIPIAIWIAARHGTRALPAIALVLAPMALGYVGEFGAVGVLLGNNFGHALAALLLARFAVDAGFREACLSATRTPPWQLAALAVLPLAYASPRFAGFTVFPNPWALVLAVAFLIGLSQAPLRGPLLALLGSSTAVVAAELAFGRLGSPGIGNWVHTLRTWPADLLSVVLALWLPRRLRGADPWPRLRPVAALIDNHPAIVAGVMMVFAYMVTVRLVPQVAGRQPTITPFLPVHLLLLSIYWTATKPSGKLFVPMGIFITLPMTLVMLVVMLVPQREIMLGPLLLIVADRGVGSTFGAILVLWVFNVLGLLLDGLLRGATPVARDLPHPAFATLPVRLGGALGTLALVALLVLAGMVLAGAEAPPTQQAPPASQPRDRGSTGGGF